MIRCKCGGRTVVGNIASRGDSRVQDALNVQVRSRQCAACGDGVHTTELVTSELQELRRRAYLWERFASAPARGAAT